MTAFTPGRRVLQAPHDNPDHPVPPGTLGTVRGDDLDNRIVIAWDNDIVQSVPADADAIPLISTWVPAGPGLTWEQTLDAVCAAGAAAGRDVADWWCQDTVGGRATGNVHARARSILQAIDDGDPALIDELPTYETGRSDLPESPSETALVTLLAGPESEPRPAIPTGQWAEVVDAYRAGFDDTLLERIARACRIVASPTGDDRDLSHLHPRDISFGRAGVFAGDWTCTSDDGPGRYRVGYAGILIDRWNGWAVFSCTRDVAAAIVADQQHERDQCRTELRGKGLTGPDLDHAVDEAYTPLYFDGDTIVADQRLQYDDPQAIDRINPDPDGRYVVMGWNWCWEAVDPMDCEKIIGELPAPGEEQQYVLLRHTPGMRVPPDRLCVTDVRWHRGSGAGAAFTASLTLDGTLVGTVSNDGTGGTELSAPTEVPGWPGIATFAAGSRLGREPVSESRLLDALVTETALDEAITNTAAGGAALLRRIDDAGHTVGLRPIVPAPRGWDALRAVGESIAAENGDAGGHVRWEIWTGHRWQLLPGSTATTTTS